MVKLFQRNHTYHYPWEHVTTAFWRKYPNPLAPHVKEIDCYSRQLNESTGTFTTQRVITCESAVPSWIGRLGFHSQLYALETCSVNADKKEMVVRSRNLSGCGLLIVEETCTYRPDPASQSSRTLYSQEARIASCLPVFSSRLENFSANSIASKSGRGSEAMEILCERIKTDGVESLNSVSDAVNVFPR